jgi:hypothetical protein
MLALDGRCLFRRGLQSADALVMSLETRAVGIAYRSRLMVAGDPVSPPLNPKDLHEIKSSSKCRAKLSLRKVPHNAG